MFFKNPVPEYKEDSPVDIKAFLEQAEYDQGDKAIIAYDDLYNLIDETKKAERSRIVGMVEEMRKIFDPNTAQGIFVDPSAVEGYNSALDTLLSKLPELD